MLPLTCNQCSAELSPSSVSLHWRRFHSSETKAILCPVCDVAGDLVDTLVHCLLHGHVLPSIKTFEASFPSFGFEDVTNCSSSAKPEEKQKSRENYDSLIYDDVESQSDREILTESELRSDETANNMPKQWFTTNVIQEPAWRLAKTANSKPKTAHCDNCSSAISLSGSNNAAFHDCAVFEIETSEKSNQCISCGARIRMPRGKSRNAIDHVCSCLKIKPYGCSSCGLRFAQRNKVRRHTKPKGPCPGGQMIVVENVSFREKSYSRDRNEKLIREGLLNCFPSLKSKWNGL